MTGVIPSDLVARVCKPVWKAGGLRQQQQPCGFDRIAGHADDAGLLSLLLALRIAVDDPSDESLIAVFDSQRPALCAQIQVARRLGARDLGVQGAPLGAG